METFNVNRSIPNIQLKHKLYENVRQDERISEYLWWSCIMLEKGRLKKESSERVEHSIAFLLYTFHKHSHI